MPVVTYVAPEHSDGIEATRWHGLIDKFVAGVPEEDAGYLSAADLPAITVKGGFPHRTEYLHGAGLSNTALQNFKAQFTAEENEHSLNNEVAKALRWLKGANRPSLSSPDQSLHVVTLLRAILSKLDIQ